MIPGLKEMDLPKNPHMSPHTHYLHALYIAYIETTIKYTLPAYVSSDCI